MIGELITTGYTYNTIRNIISDAFSGTSNFNNLEASGNLSGSSIYSGATNISTIFSLSGSSSVMQAFLPGVDILTGGTFTNPTISISSSPVFDRVTTTGTSALNVFSLSATSITGSTLYVSNATNNSTVASNIYSQNVTIENNASGNTLTAGTITTNFSKLGSISATTIRTNTITGTSISATTILSGATNVFNQIHSASTQSWSSSTSVRSLVRTNLNNIGNGTNAFVVGTGSTATGLSSVIFGAGNTVGSFAIYGTAFNSGNTVSGEYGHAEGFGSLAAGNGAHSEGGLTYADNYSHSGGLKAGNGMTASWNRGHGGGVYSTASLSAITTNSTSSALSISNGTGDALNISSNSAYKFKASILAVTYPSMDSKEWESEGLVRYDTVLGVTYVGIPTIVSTHADASLATATISAITDIFYFAMTYAITGVTATNIKWFGKVDFTQVI